MKNMDITIICPLYNAEKYIKQLDTSIKNQKNIDIKEIKYILTESNDNTEEILIDINAKYLKIKKEEFSHSLSREKAAMEATSNVVVFITQDIMPDNENWLKNLVYPIFSGEVHACYSRQLCDNDSIEKYTRQFNYKDHSFIVTKDDIDKMGLKTFFFSDASSAIDTNIFKSLNGYDGKKLPTSEDMYIAYKLIMSGYKIKYCADSIIHHSHTFTFKQYYDRYKLIGMFFKQNPYLDKYGTNKSGSSMAIYILKSALKDKNYKVLVRFVPNMIARFFGMKVGKLK